MGNEVPWPRAIRAEQLAELAAAVVSLPIRTQILTGVAGVGKSVLAAAVAERLRERTLLEVFGFGELSNVPLGAFAPTLVKLGIDAESETAVQSLLRIVGADAERYLLLVDDAPRLDEVSAAVVYQLVRGFGVAVIATARVGETLPPALQRLSNEGLSDTVQLDGLDAEQVYRLLHERFGAPVRHEDVARLHARTEGNPLYLRVLVETAVREGAVHADGGYVQINDGGTPLSLVASIAEILSGLPEAERRQLRLMALLQPADPAQFGFFGTELAGIEALQQRGLLVSEAGSRRLRLAHPLISEALQKDTVAPGLLADAVTRLSGTGASAHRYAAVGLQAQHDMLPDATELLWAAEYAQAQGDLASALRLAALALEHDEDHRVQSRAHLVLAVARSTTGDLDEAEIAFSAAEQAIASAEDRAMHAARFGEHLAFRRFDADSAVAVVEHAQAKLPGTIAAALDSELKLWRGLLGQVHERSADLSVAIERHPEVAVRSAMAQIMTESMSGQTEGAAKAAAALIQVQERLGVLDPAAAALIGFESYFDLLSRGEHEQALELAQARRASGGDGVGIWTSTVAEHLSYNGRLADACRVSSLAVDQCRWRDVVGVLALALAVQADTTAKAGDHEEARRLLAAMDPAQRNEPKAVMMIAECEAWLAQANGDREGAAAIILNAAESAADIGFRLVASISLGLCIRLGVFDEAASQLEKICREVPPTFGLYTALRDLATSLRDHRPELVADAALCVSRAGMAPTAIDGITLALRMRPSAEVRRKLELVSNLISVGVDAPLLQTREMQLLSAREHEVALAAAKRERSREIANRLGISTRTVDNQLQAAYRKLGVASRDDLRSALDELGVLDDMA